MKYGASSLHPKLCYIAYYITYFCYIIEKDNSDGGGQSVLPGYKMTILKFSKLFLILIVRWNCTSMIRSNNQWSEQRSSHLDCSCFLPAMVSESILYASLGTCAQICEGARFNCNCTKS